MNVMYEYRIFTVRMIKKIEKTIAVIARMILMPFNNGRRDKRIADVMI